VTGAYGFQSGVLACKSAPLEYAMFILGHSIPLADKRGLIAEFRKHCPKGTIIALKRSNESQVDGADYLVDTDPRELVALVNSLLKPKHSNLRVLSV
jgi:hypothetical protein